MKSDQEETTMKTEAASHEFWQDPESERRGIHVDIAVITGVSVRREDRDLEQWKRAAQVEIREAPVDTAKLDGYRVLIHGAGNTEAVSSPEYLIGLTRRTGRMPRINTVVDAYNVESARLEVVASAHDLNMLRGPVRLVTLCESTPFEPLGNDRAELIPADEWGIRDDVHMLCRMCCKQSRRSSVVAETTNLLIYVQGNPAYQGDALRCALDRICEAVIRFNGGQQVEARRVVPTRSTEMPLSEGIYS
jgi:DNA/RNA-binding domain of Phe-tRNA-synthetase-like protein